jgi:transposase
MLRNDVIVRRPEGTKIYKQRECFYVYKVIKSEYKKDKKYVIESRRCIGKMIDGENMNPNENYFEYYEVENEIDNESPRCSDALQIGASTLLLKIMNDLKICELLTLIHGEEGAKLIEDLVCYMIIRQTSAMQHYSEFAWNHYTASIKNWDDCRISEFLKNDVRYAQIERFLAMWNEIQPEHSGVYISYDSTNMNTKAEGVEMAEYGYAKDDDSVPQVNISYAVNQEDATPLFYEMYPGSIIDNSQCTHMVERAKEYGYRNIGLILDRGYFSMANIRYFDKNGYNFVMMVKTSSTIVADKIAEARLSLSTKAKYYIPEHEVYALTKEGKIADDKSVRYFHIYYDNVRANIERNEYLKQVVKKEEHLQKKVEEKIRRKEDLVAYEKYFKLRYDDYGYLVSYSKNDNKIQQEIDKLGFFAIITSQNMTALEAIDIYRKRDSVEKIFRMLKTSLEYDTFRVHSQSSLESKTYAMFVAGIVRNYLFQGLKSIKESNGDKKNFTVPAAINELEKVVVVKNSKNSFVRRYGLTAKQKKIFGQFGITETYINGVTESVNKRF